MATYSTNEFKAGLKVMLDGDPASIVENEFVKPGKGQAFSRVRIRNLKTGRTIERTFKSGETIEAADRAVVGDNAKWLKEQDVCIITLFNGVPLIVEPPNTVVLKVTETDPGLKGDTSGGGGKPATLETGAIVRVPLFVQIGETIKVNTRTGEYVSRA